MWCAYFGASKKPKLKIAKHLEEFEILEFHYFCIGLLL
jgi:hypothetical protein